MGFQDVAKGEEFERKAEKKIKGWGLFGSKYEDAADLFQKAANSFKLSKSCEFSGLFSQLLYVVTVLCDLYIYFLCLNRSCAVTAF